MKPLLLLTLLACATTVAAQDKVYRCGEDGRSYSAQPCPGGREVNVADPRGAAQRREAADTARREAGLAEQLARERRVRDRSARGQKAAALSAPKPAEAAASVPKKPTKKKGRERDPHLSEPVKPPA